MLFETQQHREVEERMIRAVAEKYGYGVEKCSKAYPVDAVFMKGGKAVRFVEARHRNNCKDKYPTFNWGLQKYMHVLQYNEFLPTVLLVEWEEGIYALKVERKPYPVGYYKPRHKRWDADYEPCVEIPTSEFREIIPAEYTW